MKEFADDNFKFDKDGVEFPTWVENTVWKGEIARYEQFLLFTQCFQRLLMQTRKNHGLFGKGFKILSKNISFDFSIDTFFATVNPLQHNPIFEQP